MIAEQVDSPITIAETAPRHGVMVIGKDVDISERAGDVWLTGVSWNWGPMIEDLVKQIHAGTWEPSHVRSDLAGGAAVLDPFGPKAPEALRAEVLAAKQRIVSGDLDIWAGPIVTQVGESVTAEGAAMDAAAVETMDFLVRGVVGAAQ